MRERKNKEIEEKSNMMTAHPQSSGISLPVPTLPILSQPPPAFAMSQVNPLAVPPPNHLNVTQANPLSMPPQLSQLGMPPPATNHQLTLQQAGLALSQADMLLPQPNLSIPPPNLAMSALNVMNPGQLQFAQQQGGIPFWNWGN